MTLNYFCAYRYTIDGDLVDGNLVHGADEAIITEGQVRALEKAISARVGVPEEALGITCLALLGETDD